MSGEDAHARVATFCNTLPLRPDGPRVRQRLGEAFAAHVADLWPQGDPSATPTWIMDNVDGILGTLERLYARAIEADTGGAAEFLGRMSWLPPLLAELHEVPPLDG